MQLSLPVDMKNGILNLPSNTLSRRAGRVPPSNGSARQISTYRTTPRLCQNQYSFDCLASTINTDTNSNTTLLRIYQTDHLWFKLCWVVTTSCNTYPNIQLWSMIEFSFKDLWGSIRGTAAPCV